MARLYRYTVSGNGPFTFDMLRYDAAWPATTEDAMKLRDPDTAEAYKARREITLIGIREPTRDRWRSFMWRVDDKIERI